MKKNDRLGKGLDSLLGGGDMPVGRPAGQPAQDMLAPAAWGGVSSIPLGEVSPNTEQPRTHFDEEALHDLAKSIKEVGVIQPITVRELRRGEYQIISGERRFRAAKIAGLDTIPAYVRSTDDRDVLLLGLIENIQREDLDAMEIAVTYNRLQGECNLTQEELSERVGKKRSTVANYLRLLDQPAEVQAAVRGRKITMGHARAIAGLDDMQAQVKLVRKAIDEGLSVRQVEELVRRAAQPAQAARKAASVAEMPLPESYFPLMEAMERVFNTTIAVKRSEKGHGSITIRFADDKELGDFLARLTDKG